MSRLLITCEHGGNRVPARWRRLFAGRRDLLASHRGHDPGALALARRLAERLGSALVVSTVSRLLVDLNRSPWHPRHFSEVTRGLPCAERERIDREHFLPYRSEVERRVREAIEAHGHCVHVSVHSFTPVLDGDVRRADVGLLYDPARPGEVALADRWRRGIVERASDLVVRRNYPYLGKADGLTTSLRRGFSAQRYIGVELELNQRHVLTETRARRERVLRALIDSLEAVVSETP